MEKNTKPWDQQSRFVLRTETIDPKPYRPAARPRGDLSVPVRAGTGTGIGPE
jgi:hypothetical protein